MPWRSSEKAREKMPAEAESLRIGVGAKVQERPPSREWKTRAPAGPPVPNQTSDEPRRAREVLLAAKAPSPATAGGVVCRCQCAPPSEVVKTAKRPSTG